MMELQRYRVHTRQAVHLRKPCADLQDTYPPTLLSIVRGTVRPSCKKPQGERLLRRTQTQSLGAAVFLHYIFTEMRIMLHFVWKWRRGFSWLCSAKRTWLVWLMLRFPRQTLEQTGTQPPISLWLDAGSGRAPRRRTFLRAR